MGKELQAGAVWGVCVEAAEGREGGFELLEGVGVGERAQTEVGEGGKVAEVAAEVVGIAEEQLEGRESEQSNCVGGAFEESAMAGAVGGHTRPEVRLAGGLTGGHGAATEGRWWASVEEGLHAGEGGLKVVEAGRAGAGAEESDHTAEGEGAGLGKTEAGVAVGVSEAESLAALKLG